MFGKLGEMATSSLNGVKQFFKGGDEPVYDNIIVEHVETEFTRRQSERRPFELQWRMNTEYISGNQYLEINTATMTLEEVPLYFDWQEREVFNQIATIHETRVARLSRQKPMMKTRPSSVDHGDVSAAKVSSMLLGSSWNDQEMDQAYNDQYIPYMEATGTVFYKTVWNPDKGRVVYEGPDLEQTDQEESAESNRDTVLEKAIENAMPKTGEEKNVKIREGDIETIVVPAYEIYPDSSWRDDVKHCRSIIHARAYHVDEIEEMWGKLVEPEDCDAITMQHVTSGMAGLGYASGSYRQSSSKLEKHAIVKEYYERPCKKYPNGRFIVVASKKLLYIGDLPYELGVDGEKDLPFIRTVSTKRAGCFWGVAVTERLISVQRRYNALRNRKAEYLNLITIGQWYVPENSMDDITDLNNAPGNIISYRTTMNGAKPEPVSFPSLPSSFENELQIINGEFTQISGVSELSRFSEAPSGVKSGVALGITQEQDDSRLGSTAANIANANVRLGKFWIRLYRQFVMEPRLLRSVGNNRFVEVQEWTESDLKSDDVLIENASALAETPTQRRQMVMDLIAQGLFDEQSRFSSETRSRIFEMIEFGHWESGDDDITQLQRGRAIRENHRLIKGIEAPQLMTIDDHEVHLMQHKIAMLQADYEELVKTPQGQMINMAMMQHIQEHEQAIQFEQQKQMLQQLQMQMQGQAQPA